MGNMTTGKLQFLILAVFLTNILSGCRDKDEAKAALPEICEYFPGSQIYKFDRRVLWIQTKVDGISSATAAAMFEQACQKAARSFGRIQINITTELNFDGRSILLIGFRQYLVAWEVRNGVDERGIPRYEVMNWQEAPAWFMQHVGYRPQPDRILVINLQDVLQTPKGQQMQLRSLAQLQQQRKQQLQQLQPQ